MHHLFFSTKRVHHRALAQTRPLAEAFGLTPARFDMLSVIARHRLGITQRFLCRALGVTGATVSRMARSLADLGLIVRARCTRDRRLMVAQLSERGEAVYRAAKQAIIDKGVIEPIVRFAFAAVWSTEAAFNDLLALNTLLDRGRFRMQDCATLYYPWYPDRDAPSDLDQLVEEMATLEEDARHH